MQLAASLGLISVESAERLCSGGLGGASRGIMIFGTPSTTDKILNGSKVSAEDRQLAKDLVIDFRTDPLSGRQDVYRVMPVKSVSDVRRELEDAICLKVRDKVAQAATGIRAGGPRSASRAPFLLRPTCFLEDVERYEILILGSGEAGKYLTWTMAKAGHRTAIVERKHLGGSCPNVACLPSKNLIYCAKVASLARRGAEFGLEIDSLSVNMAAVQRRKQMMVEGLHQMHVDRQMASGGELIMGNARFVAPRTVEVARNDGGTRTIFADCVILAVGSRATMPNIPGLAEAQTMTHIEALDLDRIPEHLIVVDGGYVGLELSQAMRRFGSQVTVIRSSIRLAQSLPLVRIN